MQTDHQRERRQLGNSGLWVSPIALGCWPISGMTSLHVTPENSLATLRVCIDEGLNFLDTAYNYGRHGESEKMIAQAIRGRRAEVVIATKGGLLWDENGKQAFDARPESLLQMCDESLRRLESDYIDLWYLHAPDPKVPVAESAGAIKQMLESGKIRAAGLSNATVAQLEEFRAVCPLTAFQPHFNMLQREIEADRLPWCRASGVAVCVYWALMKGLLAGKLPRDHVFQPGDGRAKYPMFQGEEWQKNQDFLADLREIATEVNRTVSAVVLNWTIQQPGITCALVGAKRPDQVRENAAALGWRLSPEQLARIDAALLKRGPAVSRGAV